jgi:hypothetical protein
MDRDNPKTESGTGISSCLRNSVDHDLIALWRSKMSLLAGLGRLLRLGGTEKAPRTPQANTLFERKRRLEEHRRRAIVKGHPVPPPDPPAFAPPFDAPAQTLPKNGFKFKYRHPDAVGALSGSRMRPGTKEFGAMTEALALHDRPGAPLSIRTRGDVHHFVRLSDWQDDFPILAVFIRAGRSIHTEVPVGTYRLKFGVGRTWYGERHMFGPETTFAQADRCLEFSREGGVVSGHKVELFAQASGNLSTSPIQASEW